MSFNNQQVSPSNIYATSDLVFLVIILWKKHSPLHWCVKCKSPSKYSKLFNHSMGDEWTIETLKVIFQSGKKHSDSLGFKEELYWDCVEVNNFILSNTS